MYVTSIYSNFLINNIFSFCSGWSCFSLVHSYNVLTFHVKISTGSFYFDVLVISFNPFSTHVCFSYHVLQLLFNFLKLINLNILYVLIRLSFCSFPLTYPHLVLLLSFCFYFANQYIFLYICIHLDIFCLVVLVLL